MSVRPGQAPAPFRHALGARLDALPFAVRAVHGNAGGSFAGTAVARTGRSLSARILKRLLRLPGHGRHDVTVTIRPDRGGETWIRTFGATRFASQVRAAPCPGLLEERVGPLRFRFRVEETAGGLGWRLVGWRFAGFPLPVRLGPRIRVRIGEREGRYRFGIVVRHPFAGLLFSYRGALAVPPASPDG